MKKFARHCLSFSFFFHVTGQNNAPNNIEVEAKQYVLLKTKFNFPSISKLCGICCVRSSHEIQLKSIHICGCNDKIWKGSNAMNTLTTQCTKTKMHRMDRWLCTYPYLTEHERALTLTAVWYITVREQCSKRLHQVCSQCNFGKDHKSTVTITSACSQAQKPTTPAHMQTEIPLLSRELSAVKSVTVFSRVFLSCLHIVSRFELSSQLY